MGSLVRDQLRLALRILLLLAVSMGGLPLVFHLVPRLADTTVVGVPLPWVLLGVLVYPWLITLGLGVRAPGRAARARLRGPGGRGRAVRPP